MHDDLGTRELERPRHPDVIGMKVRDEHAPHVFDRGAGLRECGEKRGLGFLRVHARVDEGVARRPFDQVRVNASEGEWKRKCDAPDARRDDRRLQRERSIGNVIAVRMDIPRPVRLVA